MTSAVPERGNGPHDPEPYDTVGVGFGPSNIALAVAHDECASLRSQVYVEAGAGPSWQPGMIIDGSDIQHNPLRDFITPKNPQSRYGYLAYLKSQDRLFHYLNLDAPYPPRSDYARYVNWVAGHFADKVHFSETVTGISLTGHPGPDGRRMVRVTTGERTLLGRSLSFAPGRSKNIPEIFRPVLGEQVFHFTDYTTRRDKWRAGGAPGRVAVLGASQSAVEILLDLRAVLPGTALHGVFRGFSFALKDTSPFTEDLLYPSYTDYFYDASPESKRRLTEQVLRSNYGSADHDVLRKLYFSLYEDRVRGEAPLTLHGNSHVTGVDAHDGGVTLALRDEHTGATSSVHVDAVVLATGFRNFGVAANEELCHPLIADVAAAYATNADGTPAVTRSYQLVPGDDPTLPPVFLNGLCESSHGMGDAGSFSLLSYRASDIERALAACL